MIQTAGLVVAARLTENPAVSVLVLEAGEANLNDPIIRECTCLVPYRRRCCRALVQYFPCKLSSKSGTHNMTGVTRRYVSLRMVSIAQHTYWASRSSSGTLMIANMSGLGQYSCAILNWHFCLSITYRGKGLGGSSAINFMLWNKPARQYLDSLYLFLCSLRESEDFSSSV